MLYYVHFAAAADDPMPPLAMLPTVEADSPEQAARLLVAAGRVPHQGKVRQWARVVLSQENGRATQVLRLPLVPIAEIPIRSANRRDHRAY